MYLVVSTPLLPLQDKCARSLQKRITPHGTCLDLLLLAHVHHADSLKQAALCHITRHREHLFRQPGWNAEIKNHPDLMTEVIEALAKKTGGNVVI